MTHAIDDRGVNPSPYGRRSKLHLLWALPSGFAAASASVVLALWDWCAFGRGGCEAVQPIGQLVSENMVYLAFGGLFAAAVIATAPWTGRAWARIAFGLCFGLGTVVTGLIYMIATSDGAAM